jgi:hypothetical protein
MDQCHVCVGSNWCECGCSQSPFILKQQLEPGLGNDVSGNLKFVPLAADADGLSQRTVNRKMGRVLQMRRAKYARHVDFFHVVPLETVAHLQGALHRQCVFGTRLVEFTMVCSNAQNITNL